MARARSANFVVAEPAGRAGIGDHGAFAVPQGLFLAQRTSGRLSKGMSLSAAEGCVLVMGAALGAYHGAGAFGLAGGLDALLLPVMAVDGLDPGRLVAAGAMGGAHVCAHCGSHAAGIVIGSVADPLPVAA